MQPLENNYSDQTRATEIRLALRDRIYRDPVFQDIFQIEIKSMIPTFCIEPAVGDDIKFIITIDRNLSQEIQGFQHRKEFYTPIIYQCLLNAYSKMIHHYNAITTDSVDKDEPMSSYSDSSMILRSVMDSCGHHSICPYRLFDITTILDNTVIVSL